MSLRCLARFGKIVGFKSQNQTSECKLALNSGLIWYQTPKHYLLYKYNQICSHPSTLTRVDGSLKVNGGFPLPSAMSGPALCMRADHTGPSCGYEGINSYKIIWNIKNKKNKKSKKTYFHIGWRYNSISCTHDKRMMYSVLLKAITAFMN